MTAPINICSLDYFIGTLATAYKGLITSLVAKDFCMTEENGAVTLKGTVLSMPAGNYGASLRCEGTEISRAELREGLFELKSESSLIKKTKNLQIDILQNGKHIGTFLLKREKADEFFVSAMELSQELKGINFRVLTAPLKGKPGLLKNAEALISKIVSTKKDWERFSEEINSFSKDLFWFDRESYYRWYGILVSFSLKSCQKLDVFSLDKPIANSLSLIELPLGGESDTGRLKALVRIWLREIGGSLVELAYRLHQTMRILLDIHERFPDLDITPALKPLIASLKERVTKSPALDDGTLNAMKEVVSANDFAVLGEHSEKKKKHLLGSLNDAGRRAAKGEYGKTFEIIDDLGSHLIDESEMVDSFFGVIERNLTEESAIKLIQSLCAAFPIFEKVSPDVYKRAMKNTAALMRKLIALKMKDACVSLLSLIEKGTFLPKADIVLNSEVASAVLSSGDDGLLALYKDILKQIVIPSPRIAGFSSETWAEMANPLHLERLSKFLSIIRLDADRLKDVLVHVICNLFVSGLFIPDDKLFQREVSAYLNSAHLRNHFLLHYLLLRKLPVFFHEVGATGKMRDYTTEIDSWGNDTVLYFLRKQVHVNASNYNIRLIEKIAKAWVRENPGLLKDVVPGEALNKLNPELLAQYSSAVQPFFRSLGILDEKGLHLEKILTFTEADLDQKLNDVKASDEVRTKILLLCIIYQEVVKKYSFIGHGGRDAGTGDVFSDLSRHIEKVKDLKEVVISPERTEPRESIFFKRHIAFGIPSVLGSYHEPKFDALGETFRHEELIRVMLEKVLSGLGGRRRDFSANDIALLISCLGNVGALFDLHDLGNFQVEELLTIMKTNTLRLSQVRDMLRIWQKELTGMVESLYALFHKPLTEILRLFPEDELSEHLKRFALPGENGVNRATDVVMRDIMNGIPGFTELDRILTGFITLLTFRLESADEEIGLSKEPETEQEYCAIDELSDSDATRLGPMIGGKAKNLVYLHNRGLPVPPGVVFTAKRTSEYREYTESEHFKSAMGEAVKKIETRTGTSFGGDRRPLFLSVRSGAYLSMPGILSSILYCGMNEKTVGALIRETDNPRLGWDSFRRFVEHYSAVVYGLDTEIFEETAGDFAKSLGKEKKEDIDAEEMKEIVSLHLNELSRRNLVIPENVYEQLKESVRAVYGSWYGERAAQFRKALSVSERWGTSVTLMQMIYGNNKGGGASVFFTRKPFSLERKIFGDTREMATGDDLVYGKYRNRPLSKKQLNGEKSLEETDPELFSLHEKLAGRIENAMGGLPQEAEVTYIAKPDGERLIYVLQTRRMEFYRGFTKRFSDVCRMESNIIGRGVGVHGGALSGIATFSSSPQDIKKLREMHDLPVILLRNMASTDDVSLMPVVNGIVAAAGGVASHASVLAQKFDLTAVVGCSDMEIRESEKGELYAKIGNLVVAEGAPISIDGSTGLVYSGFCQFTL